MLSRRSLFGLALVPLAPNDEVSKLRSQLAIVRGLYDGATERLVREAANADKHYGWWQQVQKEKEWIWDIATEYSRRLGLDRYAFLKRYEEWRWQGRLKSDWDCFDNGEI